MTETINFNSANAVSENVNVANATSENANVVIATSDESKKTKKMKLNESFKKRITKNGEYRTGKFTIKEVENLITEAIAYKCFLEKEKKNKNYNKIVNLAKDSELSNSQIDELMQELAAMKTAA